MKATVDVIFWWVGASVCCVSGVALALGAMFVILDQTFTYLLKTFGAYKTVMEASLKLMKEKQNRNKDWIDG